MNGRLWPFASIDIKGGKRTFAAGARFQFASRKSRLSVLRGCSIAANGGNLKPARVDHTTKKDQLIKLLGTKTGADIKTLSAKLGWQQHTTRAAMSGLRKAGYEVSGEKPAKGGMSRFRILSVPLATGNPDAVASHGA